MTQDYTDPTHNSRKEVELFPVVADRPRQPATMVAPRPVGHERMNSQISMFAPVTFEEAVNIVECLRARASATISLENMRKSDADRLVDFVAGASAAIDGNFHKLNDVVYLFCPSNIRIVTNSQSTTTTTSDPKALDYLFPEGSPLSSGNYTGYNS